MSDLSVVDAMAVIVPAVGALAWLLRLEGRINVTDSRYDEILRRLSRIEAKQDL